MKERLRRRSYIRILRHGKTSKDGSVHGVARVFKNRISPRGGEQLSWLVFRSGHPHLQALCQTVLAAHY
jgi:hypothetical protein